MNHKEFNAYVMIDGALQWKSKDGKLEVGLYQGYYIREHEVPRGGEASDETSPPKMQEGEVHDGTLAWEFQGV